MVEAPVSAKCPPRIQELVDRFRANIASYRSPTYKEAQLRQEFLDPFFAELGWDMDNRAGAAPQYRDVIHEDAISVSGTTKAPDYCFTLSGARKFFVEAKKPAVNLLEGQEAKDAAYQLRRYGWSSKLPLCILTDFEHFAVYDTRVPPKPEDSPTTARVRVFHFEEFVSRWGTLDGTFSKDSVLKGRFDIEAASKNKRGTAEVDDAFLAEIESWREELAGNLKLRNQDLTQGELNYAVQSTIDRIIFLRICEDRGIEPHGRLRGCAKNPQVYRALQDLFRQADEKYNSGIFHFHKEKGRNSAVDTLTPGLEIDDKVLRVIISRLYYPDSPYEFSILPAEVLGQVYEQFLGKVIVVTEKRARIEEKPEVKKAGGVYYTPSYIVEHIVKNTIGKLVEGKTVDEVAEIRVVDPACGSGSFLLVAYQFLLDWHLDRYAKQPKKWKQRIVQVGSGAWALTSEERSRILLTNIFGVDIDGQAVEVTKLSLLLKVLEKTPGETLETQLKLTHKRALPDLDANVKCGNSVIASDYWRQSTLFDTEGQLKINAFDWPQQFLEVFARPSPGFDAVIGNPPYVFGRDWTALGIGEESKTYFRERYKTSPYQLDMFSIFMEKAHQLCRRGGRVGLIVPNVWLNNTYSMSTRSFVFGNSDELQLTVPPPKVFQGLTVDTIIYALRKSDGPGSQIKLVQLDMVGTRELAILDSAPYLSGERPVSIASSSAEIELVDKIKANHPQLGTFAEITRGVHPYRTGGYGKSAFQPGPQTSRDVEERPYHSKERKSGFRPFVYGKDLRRYGQVKADDFVKYGDWLAEPRSALFFEGDRIYSRKILANTLVVTLETENSVADQQVYVTKPNTQVDPRYLLAILASRPISFYVRNLFGETNDAFPQIKVSQLREIPIPAYNPKDPACAELIQHVDMLLKANQSHANVKTDREREVVQREIQRIDGAIDHLVGRLYHLSPAEMKKIEEFCASFA